MNNFKDTLAKVKSRGYWKLVIEPVFQIDKFFNHEVDIREYVNQKKISIRGWDYPHIPNKRGAEDDYEISNGKMNSFTDWNHFKECWSYYQSGQFVHVFGLREDWFCESDWFDKDHQLKKVTPMTVLDFVWANYSITEMFLFTNNIVNDERYKGEIKISITLHNTKNRHLTVFDPRRIPIFSERKSTTDNLIGFNDVTTKEILNNNHLLMARNTTINIIKYFDWSNPPVKVIEDDQLKLINRKL